MEELRLNNWAQFSQIIDHLDVGDPLNVPYAFRGHSDVDWLLQPTFLRSLAENNINEERALALEKAALSEFKSQAHLHLTANEYSLTTDTVSWWTVMQHHGAPTRLLDWTSSIYAAAYFAVCGDFEKDGAIILVHTNSVHSKMDELYGDATFPKTENEIQSNYLQVNAPSALRFAGRMSKSSRMVAQQGFFSICRNIVGDHGKIMDEIFQDKSNQEVYRKLIIPNNQKKIFLRKLRTMNVTASSLFPGLDGLGKSVKELLDVATN